MPAGSASAGAEAVENYRYFLRAAVLVGMIAGAALGTVNLTWIARWGYSGMTPDWSWWPALIQAHGNAQLYGWTGLFIMGVTFHSIPRMTGRPAPGRRLVTCVFALVLSGLLIALFAQPLASAPGWGAAFLGSAALQALGVLLFAAYVLRTIARPREPYQAFVAIGAVWFAVSATSRVAFAAEMVRAGDLIPPAAWNAAYLHAMSWGFLLCFVAGYSLRLLPAFTGAPPASKAASWFSLGLFTPGALLEVAARMGAWERASVAAALLTLSGTAALLIALRLPTPLLNPADRGAAQLLRFSRVAYFWLAMAVVLFAGLRLREAEGPLPLLLQHAFGGASRHALTVGFVSLMIVGVAWRILPLFSGAEPPHPALVPAVFWLLVTGNTLRVSGQIAAGLWGGLWYAPMGISGWLELAGVSLFAVDVLRLMRGAPNLIALEVESGEVAVALDAPVGPLVATHPWLVPVFAAHGMEQVSNVVFQRTVGRRVTVAQSCVRFGVATESFLQELRSAEQEHGHAPA